MLLDEIVTVVQDREQRPVDQKYKGDIANWGETVMFQEAASYTGALNMNRRRRKADARFRRGIWVGRGEDTNEHIVLTEDGVFLTRSVRRLPKHLQADKELLLKSKRYAMGAT